MTVTNGTRDESVVRYDDRLPVRGRALLPAIAIGVGAGLVVFYIARLMAERAPLVVEPLDEALDRGVAPARTSG
ncbi:MAG TPA: hypothetical protein VK511_06725 [Gemmatimonadaceae bacterium]|nr:hypothetical protein [Gemmatimonadaceae bacterium]